ncbi:MAG: DMT family transporter, partial [Gammaproteobacteria bacterium]|nr:DMT family transporter [Gammaproteobacteria bacterium]
MRHIKITIAVITAHTLTGTASVATRYLVAWLEPVEIVFLRYLFGSALIFTLFLLVKPRPSDHPYVLKSLMLGILFFALFPFLFSTAFYYTTAAHGALVIATMPVWAMLIAHVTRHEHLNPRLL